MIKRICNLISAVIMLFLLAFVALLFIPRLMGYQSMAVVSGSMEPNIPVGAIVIVNNKGANGIEVGDPISYRISDETVVTHRVVEINAENKEVITKGDANDTNDASPVSYENIIGKVIFSIPHLGYIIMYIRTPLGIAGACGVLFLLIIVSIIPSLLEKEKNTDKKEKRV